ncbi:hypothetical protein [Serratia rubidaea]|uniref:hypothetical protein n=1 Tax=Serratia rubidaea TaxID=61652 RepID=UPI002430151D|nr:hypothetical protein [Serratia rubidaea]MCR1000756.1 hypothetical protein [Serratia rubidaea]
MKNQENIKKNVSIINNGKIQVAEVNLEITHPCILTIKTPDGEAFKSQGDDFFDCFVKIRKNTPQIIYQCKGAKRSVFPSGMTRSMSFGLKAYDAIQGLQTKKENEVDIFDYENHDIVSDPEEQVTYWKNWLSSL